MEYDGNSNEWAVAYHGIGCKLGSTVENATENIYKKGFKAGDDKLMKMIKMITHYIKRVIVKMIIVI